jgi:hypothetical protein
MDRDRHPSHHWDSSDRHPIHINQSEQPFKVETLDEDSQEYRVDQFGKAIVGTPGFGEFGLGPREAGHPSVHKVVMSPEDMRILRECNSESFYKRCLPLGIAGNILTFMYYQNKPKATGKRFWPYLTVTLAAWIGGKISYRSKCEDKLLNAGHRSALVEAIRKKRGISESEFDADQSWQVNVTSDWRSDDQQQSRQATSHFNDMSSSSHGYDASSTGSDDQEKLSVTYDSLRQQNRSRASSPPQPSQSNDLSGRSKPAY